LFHNLAHCHAGHVFGSAEIQREGSIARRNGSVVWRATGCGSEWTAIQSALRREGAEIINSANAEQIDLPIREALPAESFAQVINLCARWQTAVEIISGYELQQLRLELAPSVSKLGTHLNAWEQ